MIFKLISKVIINRLKPLMDSIILSSPSAFIPSQIITDNILIAHELLHSMKNNTKGKIGRMVVKLDMSKVYNRVEWQYLKASMKALNFVDRWINLVISCVTSVNYSILLNGYPNQFFSNKRTTTRRSTFSSFYFMQKN